MLNIEYRTWSTTVPAASRPRRVMAIMIAAGLVSTLMPGCAMDESRKGQTAVDPAMSNAAVYTQVTPMPLQIRSNQTTEGYYALGKFYFYQGRLDKARYAFENALRVNSRNVDAMNGLAAVYDRWGRYDESGKIYKAALALDPKSPLVWANLGYSLILQGKKWDAIHPMQQALHFDPDNTMARSFLETIGDASKLASCEGNLKVHETLDSGVVASISQPQPFTGMVVAATTTPAVDGPIRSIVTVEASSQVVSAVAEAHEAPSPVAVVVSTPQASGTISVASVESAASVQPASVDQIVVHEPATSPLLQQTLQANPAESGHIATAEPVVAAETVPSSAQTVSNEVSTTPAPGAVSVAAGQSEQAGLVTVSELPPTLRVEISNGNGVEGMARAVSGDVRHKGVNVARITNAKPFNKARTTIVCRAELRGEAVRLASLLPGPAHIIDGSTEGRRVDIRVVLGADSVQAFSKAFGDPVRVAVVTR